MLEHAEDWANRLRTIAEEVCSRKQDTAIKKLPYQKKKLNDKKYLNMAKKIKIEMTIYGKNYLV